MKKNIHIAFVGMGSIGQRHLRNVCQLISERGDTYSIDLYRSSFERSLPESVLERIDHQYLLKDEVKIAYDVVFITNPTSLHLATAIMFYGHTKSLFIEKPVFDSVEIEDGVIRKLDNIPSYVACPLRYNPVIRYLEKHIDRQQAYSVRAISSSYLPDWRPGQDYRQCYSAHRDLGGGVGIDLIHEWDYLTFLFGMPTECLSIQTKVSQLEIDSDDVAIYIARNNKTCFELHLDYFGRKAIRTLDVFLPDDTIHCDILAGTVEYLRSGKKILFENERNYFQKAELIHFFEIAEGGIKNDSSVSNAVRVLNLSKGII